MAIQRSVGFAPRVQKLANDIQLIQGSCIGCTDCRGLCEALLEAMTLPELLLARTKA